jgi:hypothetical protein
MRNRQLGFMQTLERATGEAKIYVGIQLGSNGIDVVESVIKDNLSVLLEN